MELTELLSAAQAVKANSYSPYSKFKVGASILTANNKVYIGCNVESCSYGATLCAEGSAIASMVADGERKIASIVVTYSGAGDSDKVCYPCGICLQKIAEFADESTIVYLASNNKIREQYKFTELLPKGFVLADMLK